MRALVVAAALAIVGLVVSYTIYRRVVSYAHPGGTAASAPLLSTGEPAEPRLGYGNSSLAYLGNLAVLRLVGLPRDIGAAHGRLLGEAVDEVSRALEPCMDAAVPVTGWLSEQTRGLRLRWRLRLLDDGVPGHQLVEIAGVLRGARRSGADVPGYEAFVRDQAALDVGRADPASSGASLRTVARALSFVAPVRDTSGDRLLIGRTAGLPGASDGGEAAARHVTVSFVHADGVIPFAAVGWPGLVGVLAGVNAEGVAVMVHLAHTADVRPARAAQPVALLARDVLENARDLDEAIQVLQHGSPLGSAAYLIVDGNARAWAVVERSPSRAVVLRDPGPAVVTDILTAEQFQDDPLNDRAARNRPARLRAERLQRLLRESPPRSPDDAAALLRDHRGPGGVPLPPGHRGAVFDASAVHTAVFDAAGMVLWVADGPTPNARFRAFDLRHELRGEGVRPAPPPDLAPAVDPVAIEPLRRARGELRRARDARRAGDARLARERVERALAHAPELPEALVLAGDLSRQLGDREAAARYYERYLAMEPDDPEAGQEARAAAGDL